MTKIVDLRAGGVATPPTGVRRWLSDTERAGLTEAGAARLSLARAIGQDSPAAGPVETWLNTIDADNTRAAYATDVRAFVEWLRERHHVEADDAPVNLLAVGMDVVAAYADAMRDMIGRYRKPLSPASRARRLASLSALYKHLAARQVVAANPVRELERPKVSTEGVTPARRNEEIGKMIQAAGGDLRDLALVLLLYVSAFRVTEVCRARVDQLHREGGRTLLAVPIKGGKTRTEPLDPGVIEILDRYLRGRTTGPLLLADNGHALVRHHVPPILRRLARAAGLHDPAAISPHVVRTSAITAWLEAGHPLQRVQHKVRHASATTTQRYHRRTRGIEEDAALSAALVAELPLGEVLKRLREEGG
ncbi:tyrosine-type recombinase/integrase [Streptosporangium sp. OZ121]|uniref:tyrosine-type recombinase/integrase n=1 Tax=Streptosporangium sp. OZ121 TaxID=3444183 RepID=UPI003F78BA29